MKNILTAIVLTTSLFAQRQIVDKIAAVVDDEIIMASEVQQYAFFEAANQKINPALDTAAFNALERKIIEVLINQKILLAQARLDSIIIDEGQVEQALDQQVRERVQQAGGEAELEKYLGKSLKEIKKLYKSNVRKQLLTQKIQNSRFQDLKISRSEIEAFFDLHKDSLPEVGASVNFSQILMEIKAGNEAFAEAEKNAKILLDSIKKGADFASLAKVFSSDPGSGKKGGDLGWFNRGDFVKEFADAAVRLEPGEISGIVKSEFGYHIIQMIEKTGEKIHTRHILIGVATGANDKSETIKKITSVRQDILDAKITFEKASLQFSDDPAKKGNLGNMGWVELSTLQDKTFLNALNGLKKDEISQPFETQFGFFICRLNDRRDNRRLNLKDDWQTIESIALREKQGKEMEKWVTQLRTKFFVDVRL